MYTIQRELDAFNFGAMWGCYATGRINIPEHERSKKATEYELDAIAGRYYRLRLALMCNYKNAETALSPKIDSGKWGPEDDPNWHWWILNRRAALLAAMEILNVYSLAYEYEEHIMDVSAITSIPGSKHYGIMVVGGELINPSPGLVGPVVEIRKVEI